MVGIGVLHFIPVSLFSRIGACEYPGFFVVFFFLPLFTFFLLGFLREAMGLGLEVGWLDRTERMD